MKVGDKVFVTYSRSSRLTWFVGEIVKETPTQWVVNGKSDEWRFRKKDLQHVGSDMWSFHRLLPYQENLDSYNEWLTAKIRKHLIGEIQTCAVAESLTNKDLEDILARLKGETK